MNLNRRYNRVNQYHVFSQQCSRAGQVTSEPHGGDTDTWTFEGACAILPSTTGNDSNSAYRRRAALNVIRAAYLD